MCALFDFGDIRFMCFMLILTKAVFPEMMHLLIEADFSKHVFVEWKFSVL